MRASGSFDSAPERPMRSLTVGHLQRLRDRVARMRERHEWVDHLTRAGERYFAQRGNHFAAATAFFSILTAVPLLMVAFAAASYVLWFNPDLLAELENAITASVPSEALHSIIETAIDQRNSIGTIGLIGALWSGVWWMSNLREAVSAQWELPRRTRRRCSGCCTTCGRWSGWARRSRSRCRSRCSAPGSPSSCWRGSARPTTA
jgi:membrane protein